MPFKGGSGPLTLPINENWHGAVRQDLDGFAAEHQRGNAAPPVRGHHDQVAAIPFRRVDDGQVGLFMLGMDGAASLAGCRCCILDLAQVSFSNRIGGIGYR